MFSQIISLFFLILTGLIAYDAYCLAVNYFKVRKLGLPVLFTPISPDNPLWIALQTSFPKLFRHVPLEVTSFTGRCRLGWEFHDRYRTHQRLGDAWIFVTPAKNWVYVADDRSVAEIFSRGKDFILPIWMLEPLKVFGPNISTSNGPEWQRQRKLTATPFNEQKSVQAWDEALRQSSDMLRVWTSRSSNNDGFTSTADDTRTLALHVLAFVAFQKSYPFESKAKAVFKDASSMTYRDSLALILKNTFLIMAFPQAIFSIPFFPRSWKQIGWAMQSFRRYMTDQMIEERRLADSGQPSTGTLIGNLVRAGEVANDSRNSGDETLKPLSESEILGNIFVYNFAGHDTTAISTCYAMYLLVANPDVQEWISEEVRFNLPNADQKTWEYGETFPKLQRCLAVLLETLRLYNPLLGAPKYTGPQSQTLKVHDETYTIPKDTLVIPNMQSVHTDPRIWGTDSLTWRPKRWISSPTQTTPTTANPLKSETLFSPKKGTYFPWADGLRNCPGKKFAQVEFVALMAVLFHGHRVDPVPRKSEGEDLKMARERVLNVVRDSGVELLLQMRNPESVRVRWWRV